jgi:hypothetical protein
MATSLPFAPKVGPTHLLGQALKKFLSSIQRNPRFRDQRKPLLLEKNEGELRTRRIHTDASTPASSQFMLKASPKNNGSQHLVAGTEHVAPGATLPKHRHLAQEEIVLMLTRFLTVNAWF